MKHLIRPFIVCAGIGLLAQKANAQAVLIAADNGATSSFALSDVQSMVFTNNTLVVHSSSCEDHYFSVFFTDYLTLDGSIAVRENMQSSLGMVYPNPAQQAIVLQSSGAHLGMVKVYSSMGALMHQEWVSSSQVKVDVAAWAPGMYIAVAEGQTYSFIKQ